MLNLKNVQLLHKHTASPTNVYFAELNGQDVALKCYVIPINQEDIDLKLKQKGAIFSDYLLKIKGLEYERRIYKSITPILSKYSPNIVEYVDSTSCSWKEFIKSINENKLETEFMNKQTFGEFSDLQKLYTSYEDIENKRNSKVVTVVTKRDKNISSLHKVLSSDIPEKEVLNILFQIMYNLTLFEDFKLMHNDLHTNNILVVIQDQPVKLCYMYDNSLYTVKTKYVIKFFDWDLSYMERLGLNEKIEDDFWRNIGIKNEFKSKFDLFTVLCYFNKLCGLNSNLSYCGDILSSLIKDTVLKVGRQFFLGSFWYNSVLDRGFDCRPRHPIPDTALDTPKVILSYLIFDNLKENNNQYTGSIYSRLSSYIYSAFTPIQQPDTGKIYSIPDTINWNP
jgi:serine/threonine protein kinase